MFKKLALAAAAAATLVGAAQADTLYVQSSSSDTAIHVFIKHEDGSITDTLIQPLSKVPTKFENVDAFSFRADRINYGWHHVDGGDFDRSTAWYLRMNGNYWDINNPLTFDREGPYYTNVWK